MLRARHKIRNDEAELRPLSLFGALGLHPTASEISDLTQIECQASLRATSAQWPFFMLGELIVLGGTVNLGALITHPMDLSLILPALSMLINLVVWQFKNIKPLSNAPVHRQMYAMLVLLLLSGTMTSLWYHALPIQYRVGLMAPQVGQISLALLAFAIFGQQRVLGLAFTLGIGFCALWWHGVFPAIMFVTLLCGIAISIRFQARVQQRLSVLRHARERDGERALRLLNDYEESGHGWFWESDRSGALTYISETLARSTNVSRDAIIGKPLTDLVTVDAINGGEGERTLGYHLSARSPFHDIAVRAAISGSDERWWAVSGRPIINEYGHFQGFRGSGSDLTEMKRSQAEVARLAEFDSLTGLANRAQMLQILEHSVATPYGRVGQCALFLLDLDRFKSVNDTMGHPAGDTLLKEVAVRLRRVVGERGVVGRLGGDEFKVVLPGPTERSRLCLLADAIIASVSQPYLIDGTQVVIGTSIGIAVCPDDGTTSDALIRNADLALYAAKAQGRGIYRFYSSEMLAEAEDRRHLEDDLRSALGEGALTLVYQPVVSASSEKIVGFEALLRWTHPVRGPISPAVFVPIAEDAGLIDSLGEWVMRTACQVAASWPDGIRVAVNVSPIQFANPALPGIVMNALASSGLAPERLELEITESAFIHEGEATDHMFTQLKAIGVRLALDDFGTGYSSLGYLRKAPFDKIKIDQSFVRGASITGSRNAPIVKSIVNLAEALGMDTTAEGVETHDELELVRALGCSQIQGFIYGKGVPADEVRERFNLLGTEAKPKGFQSSRSARMSMLRSVAIRHGDQSYVARIRNISSGGAMIEGLWNVPPDTSFVVTLAEGMTVEAVARWSVDDRVGVQFAKAVDVRSIRSAMPVRLAG